MFKNPDYKAFKAAQRANLHPLLNELGDIGSAKKLVVTQMSEYSNI